MVLHWNPLHCTMQQQAPIITISFELHNLQPEIGPKHLPSSFVNSMHERFDGFETQHRKLGLLLVLILVVSLMPWRTCSYPCHKAHQSSCPKILIQYGCQRTISSKFSRIIIPFGTSARKMRKQKVKNQVPAIELHLLPRV